MAGAGFSAVALSGTSSSALMVWPDAVSNRRSLMVTFPKSDCIRQAPIELMIHRMMPIHKMRSAFFLRVVSITFSSFSRSLFRADSRPAGLLLSAEAQPYTTKSADRRHRTKPPFHDCGSGGLLPRSLRSVRKDRYFCFPVCIHMGLLFVTFIIEDLEFFCNPQKR